MPGSKKTSPQKKLSDAFQFLEPQPPQEEQKPKRREASATPKATAQKRATRAGSGQMSLPMTELIGGPKAKHVSTNRQRRRRQDSSREEVQPEEPITPPVESKEQLPLEIPPELPAVPLEKQTTPPSTLAKLVPPAHPPGTSNGSATDMPPATGPIAGDAAPHPPPETTASRGQNAPLPPLARPGRTQLPEQEMMQLEDLVWEMLWPVLSRRGDETVRRLVAMQDALKRQETLVRQTTERLGQIARAVESVAGELQRGMKIELDTQRRRVVDEAIQGWTGDLSALGRRLNEMMLGWSDVMATSLKDVKRVYAMIKRERQAMETRRARERWSLFWAALAGAALGGLVVAALVMTQVG